MLNPGLEGLSEAEIASFVNQGFVRLDGAFPRALADEGRNVLWRAAGLSPDRPEMWTQPVVRLSGVTAPCLVAAATTPRLCGAYDALVGAGRWAVPAVLGTFPVRFPSAEPPGDDGWHIDVSFGLEAPDFMDWRVNVASRGRALLMLLLFSDVGPDDAPTRIRIGSHRHIARALAPHGKEGRSLRDLAADGFASTAGCDEALAVGEAGTAYLCHPFLVHAAQAHRGRVPRFMAQPPLLPVGDLDPECPVQVTIREALA